MSNHKARCACGAVEVALSGSPILQCYCHCSDCRDWLGAPVHGATGWRNDQVKWVKGADDVTVYKRTDKSHRKACRTCGGAVLVEHPSIGVVDVLASNIKDMRFEPAFHIYYGERMISMKDGLPKYRTTPAAMGGDDATMPE